MYTFTDPFGDVAQVETIGGAIFLTLVPKSGKDEECVQLTPKQARKIAKALKRRARELEARA